MSCVSTVHFCFMYVLDYPKVNSLCCSAVLMSWFLMSYKGRVLQHITDRVVSYISLFLSLFLDFFAQVSQYFITLWSQMSNVFPPPRAPLHNQPLQSVCCPVRVQSLPPPLQLLLGVCKADGPGCNQKT